MNHLLFLIFFVFLLPSCYESRISEPELTDLIYLDILKDIDRVKKTIVIREDEIKAVNGELQGLPPRSAEAPIKIERIRVMNEDAKRLEQLLNYHEIKLEKRIVLARMEYEIAYTEKKEWPDKKKFDNYLLAKDLDSSPIHTINKSDSSRSSTHKKDVQQILDAAAAKKEMKEK